MPQGKFSNLLVQDKWAPTPGHTVWRPLLIQAVLKVGTVPTESSRNFFILRTFPPRWNEVKYHRHASYPWHRSGSWDPLGLHAGTLATKHSPKHSNVRASPWHPVLPTPHASFLHGIPFQNAFYRRSRVPDGCRHTTRLMTSREMYTVRVTG